MFILFISLRVSFTYHFKMSAAAGGEQAEASNEVNKQLTSKPNPSTSSSLVTGQQQKPSLLQPPTCDAASSTTTNSSANAPPVVQPQSSSTLDAHSLKQIQQQQQLEFFDASSDFNKQKKSSFQITKIISVKQEGKKDENQDDLDETTNTEDLSLDVSRTTDVEHEPSSASTVHSPGGTDDAVWSGLIHSIPDNPNQTAILGSHVATSKSKTSQDSRSRFKIVKLESQDRLKRGRWTCTTFSDPSDTSDKSRNKGEQLNMTDSIYYIPPAVDDHNTAVFAPIVYTEGHPILKMHGPLLNSKQQILDDIEMLPCSTTNEVIDSIPLTTTTSTNFNLDSSNISRDVLPPSLLSDPDGKQPEKFLPPAPNLENFLQSGGVTLAPNSSLVEVVILKAMQVSQELNNSRREKKILAPSFVAAAAILRKYFTVLVLNEKIITSMPQAANG
ncbi:hypothetical protein HELRODRAFT_193803 [Helobdella robusta]|uniref:Uncharacterized protein n=1 Tax=Helobdella robusta TaxID=6412 RepID=T1FVD4_HELRO|nr:hypothetical protein HELRODRAFT_193803 [Helobdella robusta]ESN94824.1 hypothetical protein HELRODRAFT_193803 [Helobdella robusta]